MTREVGFQSEVALLSRACITARRESLHWLQRHPATQAAGTNDGVSKRNTNRLLACLFNRV